MRSSRTTGEAGRPVTYENDKRDREADERMAKPRNRSVEHQEAEMQEN